MKKLTLRILPLSIVVLTLFSVQQWLKITISTTFLTWILNFFIIYIILKFKYWTGGKLKNYIPQTDLNIIGIYLIWLVFSTIRGAFIAENYWEWKQLITGFQTLLLPILVYLFAVPIILKVTIRYWFKYALIIFILIIPFLGKTAYHFYLGPIFLVGCFLPLLPKKWRYLITGLLITMLFIDLGSRSQVIKSAIVLLVTMGVFYRRIISNKLIKFAHWTCYILPVILLYLGISGTFNIFKDLSSNEGKYVQKKIKDGQVIEEDLSVDTRTFIFEEVITSAIRHNYVIWGRTPARGNDSMVFGAIQAENLKTGKYERHANELCHTNVFTWLGLIGLLLYSLIYLRSSYMAVYKSNNIYMKFLGCFIAFRWAYGWIEDFNRFDIMNFSLWMMIAMGISIRFRSMSNQEFQSWIKQIFIFSQTNHLTRKLKIYHENRNRSHH